MIRPTVSDLHATNKCTRQVHVVTDGEPVRVFLFPKRTPYHSASRAPATTLLMLRVQSEQLSRSGWQYICSITQRNPPPPLNTTFRVRGSIEEQWSGGQYRALKALLVSNNGRGV